MATSAAAAAALSVYGGSYATQTYGNYVPYGTEPSAFYSTLVRKNAVAGMHFGIVRRFGQ